MKLLEIASTKQTPGVKFNPDSGILELSGRSIPENSFEFYNPLLIWLEEYAGSAQPKSIIQVKLEYFNTSSSKYILEIFKKLKVIHDDGKEILVEWYYDPDDEEMMETGEDYQDVTGLNFEIKELEEE